MIKMTREFFIPNNSKLHIERPELGLAVYYYQIGEKVCAIGFAGRAQKPIFNYSYQSAERREARVSDWVKSQEKAAQEKIDRKAQQKAERQAHDVKLGDIFCSVWGYEQTNVDYFQVTNVKGVSVELRRIAAQSEENAGYMTGTCVPAKDQFLNDYEPITKRISVYSGRPYVKISSFQSASRVEPIAEVAGVKIYPEQRWSSYA